MRFSILNWLFIIGLILTSITSSLLFNIIYIIFLILIVLVRKNSLQILFQKFYLVFIAPALILSPPLFGTYTLLHWFLDGMNRSLLENVVWALPILGTLPRVKFVLYGFQYSLRNDICGILDISIRWFIFGAILGLPSSLLLSLQADLFLKIYKFLYKLRYFLIGKNRDVDMSFSLKNVPKSLKVALINKEIIFSDYIRLTIFTIPLIFLLSLFVIGEKRSLLETFKFILPIVIIVPTLIGIAFLFENLQLEIDEKEMSEKIYLSIIKLFSLTFIITVFLKITNLIEPVMFLSDQGLPIYFVSLGSIFIFYISTNSFSPWLYHKITRLQTIIQILFVSLLIIHYCLFFNFYRYQTLWTWISTYPYYLIMIIGIAIWLYLPSILKRKN